MHFLLENDNDTCWVTDLNSRNGTYVNGHRVQRSRLSHGDTITAGHTVFTVQLKAEDADIARDAGSHFSRTHDAKADSNPITSDLTPEELATRYRGDRLLQLLRDHFQPLYAVLDEQADQKLLARLYSDPHFESGGDNREEKAVAQPKLYLARLFNDSLLLDMLAYEGWGRNAGIYLTYAGRLHDLIKHLHSLLATVTSGVAEKFRYYNPEVLRTYLNKCTPEEASRCLGPIQHLLVENDDPNEVLQFSRCKSGVTASVIPLVDRPR